MMFFILGKKLFSLNGIQWDRSGDGFKNYFNFAYHYNYGKGLWFDGMFYPYGEHLSYTDAQPALLMFFKSLKIIGIDFKGFELFLVQSLPICGLVIGFFFLFKIFDLFKVSFIAALVYSALVLSLSPQLFRMQSHFGLSYTFFIPMFWYFSLKFDNYSIVKKILIAGVLFLSGFVHPYMILIISFFLGVKWFVSGIQFRKINWSQLALALLPLFLFYIVNGQLDIYSDRPENPWGLGKFKTEFSDLLPFYGWLHKFFAGPLQLRSSYSEGYCYAGYLSIALPLLLLFNFIRKSHPMIEPELKASCIATVLVLSFAMGLHMVFGQWIYDLVPVLKQFRSVGRFAWVYYYVISIFGFIYLERWIRGRTSIRSIFWLLPMVLLYMIDIIPYQKKLGNQISTYQAENTLYNSKSLLNILDEQKINKDQFQAILTLPSGTEGSEKIAIEQDWFVRTEGLHLAFQTALPTTSVILSRNSLSRCLKINQLGSSDYIRKDLIEDLPNEKPFLTLIAINDTFYYSHLLDEAKYIGQTSEVALFDMPISVFQNVEQLEIYPDETMNQKAYEGFDFEGDQAGMFSSRALVFEGEYLLLDRDVDQSESFEMTMSVWFKIQQKNSDIPKFKISAWDAAQNIVEEIEFRDFENKSVEIKQDWIQMKRKLHLDSSVKRISIIAEGNHQVMDHVLLTINDEEFVKILRNDQVLHNHYIKELRK